MPLPVVGALLFAALVTLLALLWMARRLLGRLLRLLRDVEQLQGSLDPALEELRREVDVTHTEVAALGERVERAAAERRARPRRRWRPPPPR